MTRQLISTDTPGERLAAFSRAVRVSNMVFVSGTTAQDEAGNAHHKGNAGRQAAYVFEKIEAVLHQAGASRSDVVRTRIVVRNLDDSEAVARAHAEFFGDIRPANTMLHGEPLDSEMLVEVEVDAVIVNP